MREIQQDEDFPLLALNVEVTMRKEWAQSLRSERSPSSRQPAKKQGPQSYNEKALNSATIMRLEQDSKLLRRQPGFESSRVKLSGGLSHRDQHSDLHDRELIHGCCFKLLHV